MLFRNLKRIGFVGFGIWLLVAAFFILRYERAKAQTEPLTYETLKPILETRCTLCHVGQGAPLGLKLDSFEGILAGSNRGPVVIAGEPENSELIRRLKGLSQPRMPLTGPPYLNDEEISLFEAWIAEGLVEGATAASPEPVAAPLPTHADSVTYDQVASIFADRCVKCHTAQGIMGPAPEGYRLDSYAEVLASDDWLRVVPGQPEASELLRRIRGQAQPRMPFDGPPFLSDEEVSLIEAWIAEGARDEAGIEASVPAGARLRLHGTLDEAMTLNGLALELEGARVEDAAVGSYIELRGRLDADGNVVVERLRRR